VRVRVRFCAFSCVAAFACV